MNEKGNTTTSDDEIARQWARDFCGEELSRLTAVLRNNIDWDMVASDLKAECGREEFYRVEPVSDRPGDAESSAPRRRSGIPTAGTDARAWAETIHGDFLRALPWRMSAAIHWDQVAVRYPRGGISEGNPGAPTRPLPEAIEYELRRVIHHYYDYEAEDYDTLFGERAGHIFESIGYIIGWLERGELPPSLDKYSTFGRR